MVHDRRVNGETFLFGNQGGLFMNAMTWWDHQTGSVWSQVWGQAIADYTTLQYAIDLSQMFSIA